VRYEVSLGMSDILFVFFFFLRLFLLGTAYVLDRTLVRHRSWKMSES
jgi:hypothetical protein